jgi:hypothetical protein
MDYSCCAGQTVEMHGSIRELVCPECGLVCEVTPALLRAMRAKAPIACPAGCAGCHLRMRVMLYDDGEGARRLCPPPMEGVAWLAAGRLGTMGGRQVFAVICRLRLSACSLRAFL